MAGMNRLARYEMMRQIRNEGENNSEMRRKTPGETMRNDGDMRGEMYNEMYDADMAYEAQQRRRYPRRRDGTFKPRNNRTYEYSEFDDEMEDEAEGDMYARMGGDKRQGMSGKGNIIGFDTRSKGSEKLTPEKAKEWVKQMKHADGSKGEHWSMETVKKLAEQKGAELDPTELYAIMNALYSDYCAVFQRHGVTNPEFYLDMAKAWLEDSDAVKNKAMMYYDCIVKKQG